MQGLFNYRFLRTPKAPYMGVLIFLFILLFSTYNFALSWSRPFSNVTFYNVTNNNYYNGTAPDVTQNITTLNLTFGDWIATLNASLGKNYNTSDEMVVAVNFSGLLINWSGVIAGVSGDVTQNITTLNVSLAALMSSRQCSGTDKVTNVTLNSSGISIECGADGGGSASLENVAFVNVSNVFEETNVFLRGLNVSNRMPIMEPVSNNSITFEDGNIMLELR